MLLGPFFLVKMKMENENTFLELDEMLLGPFYLVKKENGNRSRPTTMEPESGKY